MKGLLVAAALVAFSGFAVSKPIQRSVPPANFSILLTTTATGWEAQCDSGCRWKGLGFSCATACPATIDANGVVTLASPRPDPTSFSIVVHHDRNGVRATSRGGTAWDTLSWKCSELPCQARIDALGVGPAKVVR